MLKCHNKKIISLLFLIAALIPFGSTQPMLVEKKTKLTDLTHDCLCEILQRVDNNTKTSCRLRKVCKDFEKAARERHITYVLYKARKVNLFDRIKKFLTYWIYKTSALSKVIPFGKITKLTISGVSACDSLFEKEKQNLENVISLSVNTSKKFVGGGLKYLPCLNSLTVECSSKFTGCGLKNTKHLRKLSVANCVIFTGEKFKLTKLQELEVVNCPKFNEMMMQGSTGLHKLAVWCCDEFTGEGMKNLTELEEFIVSGCDKFMGKRLNNLINLCDFEVRKCGEFDTNEMENLPGLRKMMVVECGKFTGEGLKNLTSLHVLDVGLCGDFTGRELKYLTNLNFLGVSSFCRRELEQDKETIEKLEKQGCTVEI